MDNTQSKSKSFFKMKWMNEISRKDNINCDKIVPINLGMSIFPFFFCCKKQNGNGNRYNTNEIKVSISNIIGLIIK